MAGVNKVILVGNLGDDPEVRSLNNGGEVVNLRVATSESWKDRDGNRQERTEWHRVVIFNENLGRVAKSISEEGLEGLSRGPDPDPQVDRTSRARTAIRPRWCCSASAASSSCSTGATAAAAAAATIMATASAARATLAAAAAPARQAAAGVRQRPGRRRSVLSGASERDGPGNQRFSLSLRPASAPNGPASSSLFTPAAFSASSAPGARG